VREIDGYEIVERLGTSVFLVARGRRHAALKLLREDVCGADALARCFTAASAASALRHPGIARVYEVGVSAAGGPFIVSELLTGDSLARRLARGPLPLPRALEIARQLARTLVVAHAQGVVHGALEPDHIIDGGDRVRLINFGVAHALTGAASYASPEQCRTTPWFDERSDLYALGALLFAMIAGRAPDVTQPRELGAPPQVRELVGRLLEKNPRNRPVSAAVVAALIDSLSSSAAPASPLHWLAAQAVH